jgi:surface protein
MFMMFNGSKKFNQDIRSWDVSEVTDMSYMFTNADSFNQSIGNWDVSKVSKMEYMFFSADSFNQDLSGWNVESVVDCQLFSNTTSSWTLPKPNFTNCNPN